MTHKSFKLNGRQTIGGFTPWQWAALVPGIAVAYAFVRLAPLPLLVRLFFGVVGVGCHIFFVYLSGFLELNLVGLAREAVAWWRTDQRYSPGGNTPERALVVVRDEREPQPPWVFEPIDLEALGTLAPEHEQTSGRNGAGRNGAGRNGAGVGGSSRMREV